PPAPGLLHTAPQRVGLPEPVRLFGTEDQQRRILPGVAKDQVSAFLLTEPDVGSDPARLRTNATPTVCGTEARRGRLRPAVPKDQVGAFLLTEPDVGSDPARMRTTATPTEDGSAY